MRGAKRGLSRVKNGVFAGDSDASYSRTLPDNGVIYLADVVITNATVNKVMSINYTVEFAKRLKVNPRLDIIMSMAGGPHIPCIDNVGSCSYNLCYARNEIEVQVASAWGNDCPVPQGSVPGLLSLSADSNCLDYPQGPRGSHQSKLDRRW
ncbi:uncharacterized protein LOC119463841 isoform X2 [Dermacentor silvarum]|uniref:uncharacterized protein LOC119463841 isoform X2 n=1 Tax=Dermacentor silvarum TaxID=543639 RepID=UPI002100DE5E|nr:uncharacterized protein LOC119463841 isoform X2 [Dermacentor silvarum]